jgi:hypothetical protein
MFPGPSYCTRIGLEGVAGPRTCYMPLQGKVNETDSWKLFFPNFRRIVTCMNSSCFTYSKAAVVPAPVETTLHLYYGISQGPLVLCALLYLDVAECVGTACSLLLPASDFRNCCVYLDSSIRSSRQVSEIGGAATLLGRTQANPDDQSTGNAISRHG